VKPRNGLDQVELFAHGAQKLGAIHGEPVSEHFEFAIEENLRRAFLMLDFHDDPADVVPDRLIMPGVVEEVEEILTELLQGLMEVAVVLEDVAGFFGREPAVIFLLEREVLEVDDFLEHSQFGQAQPRKVERLTSALACGRNDSFHLLTRQIELVGFIPALRRFFGPFAVERGEVGALLRMTPDFLQAGLQRNRQGFHVYPSNDLPAPGQGHLRENDSDFSVRRRDDGRKRKRNSCLTLGLSGAGWS